MSCGTNSAACTTPARSRRFRFMPRATTKPGDHLPRHDRRCELGRHGDRSQARLHLRQHAMTARWWAGWRRIRSTRPATRMASSRISTPARKGLNGFNAQVRDASGRMIGNWPCYKPPWGRMIAVNANTGDFAWEVPLGITESLPEGKQNTGVSNLAGPMATAGGLVFIGATNDNRFRAFDSKTGKELWVTKLDYTATAIPITYQGKNGKQYVAIVAAVGGGGGGRGRGEPAADQPTGQGLVVFALP